MNKFRLLLTAIAVAVMAAASFTAPAHATFPNRNGLIAFAFNTASGAQIFTVSPSGGTPNQITHVNGDAVQPKWSPNGQQIVFEYDLPNGAGCHVELMTANVGSPTSLTTDPNVCEGTPVFTPDGSRIFFERYDPTTNDDAIWSMNLQGGDRHRITGGTGTGVTAPKVSPDGTMLSFVDYTPAGHGALFTSSIDGSNLHQLTPFAFAIQNKQDWSPDGQHLVFTRDDKSPGLSANIATIRSDGTQLYFLTHYTGGNSVNAGGGTYSPDGQWIAFRFTNNGQNGLYKMHPDGSDMQPILPLSSVRPFNIDWGPVPQS